jgi:hypothetical protein
MAQSVLSLALGCGIDDIPVADPLEGTPWYTVQ